MEKLTPDIVYKVSGNVVPAKNVSFRFDPVSGEPQEKITPRTRSFEDELKSAFRNGLAANAAFPTQDEVLVSIIHHLHSKRIYDQCDLDNRAKTILDALKDAAYVDDRQVKMLWTQKVLEAKEQVSAFKISVRRLDAEAIRFIGSQVGRFT